MPFTISTQSFGPLPNGQTITKYILLNTATGEFASVFPEHGGIVRQLVLLAGERLTATLKTPDSPEALFADETYASALLYPFPSRIRHGIYRFEGQDYTLPFNDFGRDNSLHGFVHPRLFDVTAQNANNAHARLELGLEYTGDVAGYPFPFRLRVTYQLDAEGFSVNVTARNTGITRCPAAFGWHPYFTLNDEPIDQLMLHLPAREEITLDAQLLPTGRQPRAEATDVALHDAKFDNAYYVGGRHEPVFTTLTSERQGVRLVLEQDVAFPYLVVFTPDRRDRIALEPLTANVNAFNTGEGLCTLAPGEEFSVSARVRLEAL